MCWFFSGPYICYLYRIFFLRFDRCFSDFLTLLDVSKKDRALSTSCRSWPFCCFDGSHLGAFGVWCLSTDLSISVFVIFFNCFNHFHVFLVALEVLANLTTLAIFDSFGLVQVLWLQNHTQLFGLFLSVLETEKYEFREFWVPLFFFKTQLWSTILEPLCSGNNINLAQSFQFCMVAVLFQDVGRRKEYFFGCLLE